MCHFTNQNNWLVSFTGSHLKKELCLGSGRISPAGTAEDCTHSASKYVETDVAVSVLSLDYLQTGNETAQT